MQVNEQIYGLKEKWKIVSIRGNYPNTYPDDEKLKIANFLNATVTPSDDNRKSSTLGNAIYLQEQIDPTFDLGRPIPDMSICFTAMSGYSPYRKIRFISTRTDLTDGSNYNITEEATQEYDIFNFAYSTFTNGDYSNQSYLGFWKTDTVGSGDSSATQQLYNQKWNPIPINIGANGQPSFPNYYITGPRNSITFVTQLPVKHIVLIPFIKCRKTNDSDTRDIDLKSYLSTYKTSHPRIDMIYAKAYTSLTDTGFQQSSTPLSILNFNVLTALSDYYGRIPNNTTDAEKQTDLMIPFFPSLGITLGGCLTGTNFTRYNNVANASWNNNLNMYAYIDCVDLKWDTFTGDGTATVNNRLYCNADDYTAEEMTSSIRKAIACFGLFFCEDSSTVNTKHLDDAGMFLGILDNGIGYGDYSEGILNRNQPQWEWKDMSESPYDPVNPQPHPSSDWDDDMSLAYIDNSILTANKWYLISGDNPLSLTFGQFMYLINNVDLSTYDKNATFGLNPIDGVLQARCIYASHSVFSGHLTYTTEDHIEIGKLSLPLIGQMNDAYKIENHSIASYICANKIWIGEIYEDFRNYSPYAKISFYDAFCGSIEIDPSKIMNKYISIIQSVNLLSGDKITSLYVTENPNISNYGIRIATLHGNCSFEIPINGLAVADYARNQYLLSQKITTDSSELASTASMGFGGASISAITGNPIGALAQSVGTIANTYTAYTNLQTDKFLKSNTTPSPVKVSNGSSSVEIGVIYNPCIVLSIPKMDDNFTPSAEDEYSVLTGFAGFKIATPASLGAGTHVFDRPRINISGTVLEQMALIDQLEKGIYIKP